VKDIIIPQANVRDLDDIPEHVRKGNSFHPVSADGTGDRSCVSAAKGKPGNPYGEFAPSRKPKDTAIEPSAPERNAAVPQARRRMIRHRRRRIRRDLEAGRPAKNVIAEPPPKKRGRRQKNNPKPRREFRYISIS
jgi:hypothetical protein